MKDSCNEEIVLKKENNRLFLKCLSVSNSLNYLEKEDIINLSKSSRYAYNYVNDNYCLFRNLILTSHTA